MNRITSMGLRWEDVEKELFTEEEIKESHARADLISNLIKARDENIITQNEFKKIVEPKEGFFAKLSGIYSPKSEPPLDIIERAITKQGKTLMAVPTKR